MLPKASRVKRYWASQRMRLFLPRKGLAGSVSVLRKWIPLECAECSWLKLPQGKINHPALSHLFPRSIAEGTTPPPAPGLDKSPPSCGSCAVTAAATQPCLLASTARGRSPEPSSWSKVHGTQLSQHHQLLYKCRCLTHEFYS